MHSQIALRHACIFNQIPYAGSSLRFLPPSQCLPLLSLRWVVHGRSVSRTRAVPRLGVAPEDHTRSIWERLELAKRFAEQ